MACLRRRWVVALMLAYGAAACGGSAATVSPTAPTTDVVTPSTVPTSPPQATVGFIRGWVRDTAFRPLAAAQVELLTGPQAGLVVTSDRSGEFSFTATVDDGSRLRASKAGHLSAEVTLGPVCHGCPGQPGRSLAFYLHVLVPPVAVAGDYALTITADDACTTLPEQLRRRTYEVTIEPTPSRFGRTVDPTTSFEVRPRGGAFSGRMRFFWVNVAGHFISFELGNPSDAAVIEAVVPDGHVAFMGSAAAEVPDPIRSMVMRFTGAIEYCLNPEISEDGYRCTAPSIRRARCDSDHHQFELTRR